MIRLRTVSATTAAVALLVGHSSPVHAAGPLLFMPWAVGHMFGAVAATLAAPLIVASAAAAAGQSVGEYGPGTTYAAPAYDAAPAYYPVAPPPAYYPAYRYSAPPAYYATIGGYHSPPAYYRPMYSGPRYGSARSYYARRVGYSRPYGAHFGYASGYGYRRR